MAHGDTSHEMRNNYHQHHHHLCDNCAGELVAAVAMRKVYNQLQHAIYIGIGVKNYNDLGNTLLFHFE